MGQNTKATYVEAIRDGFIYCMERDKKCFAIGQGLWSPWYVGNSMRDLDKMFGRERVIDTPISELGTTGAAIGAALNGYRPIMVHPRMDFMLLAVDQIVNQAAKWRHMLGGKSSPTIVIRSIINRGGEQGAQHSQALHAWFAHIPGLRVLMPAVPSDARDMLIAATQSPDPVIYIDDRWCYDFEDEIKPATDIDIRSILPVVRCYGTDITLAAAGYSVHLCLEANKLLHSYGISCEVIDIRQINPLSPQNLIKSVMKTGRLMAVDGGWANSGFASELISSVIENVSPDVIKASPKRITLPAAPAPTSAHLEKIYYPTSHSIKDAVLNIFTNVS